MHGTHAYVLPLALRRIGAPLQEFADSFAGAQKHSGQIDIDHFLPLESVISWNFALLSIPGCSPEQGNLSRKAERILADRPLFCAHWDSFP